jgi:hypothetical protein
MPWCAVRREGDFFAALFLGEAFFAVVFLAADFVEDFFDDFLLVAFFAVAFRVVFFAVGMNVSPRRSYQNPFL